MKHELMQAECDPKCGFLIRSHDENEVLGVLKQHAKKVHKKAVSDSDARTLIKAV